MNNLLSRLAMALAVVACAALAAKAQPPALNSAFNGTTLAGWNQVPNGSFKINTTDHTIQTTGTARGYLYTTQTYSTYRIIYSVYQDTHLHEPSVLFFGTSDTADAMDGLQFELPDAITWDYQQTGEYANTFFPVTTYNFNPPGTENTGVWFRCEMLVNTPNASADSACAILGDPTAYHIMYFKDAAVPVENIPTPWAIQAHQTGVSDEYKDIYIENEPTFNQLVLLALPAPSALTATSASSQINLSWKINSTSQTGFEVFHSTDNQTWTLVDTTTADATTYSDTSLASNTTYYYRIAAVMSNAISDYATASATSGTGGCTPSAITPGIRVNVLSGGTWMVETSVTVPSTATAVDLHLLNSSGALFGPVTITGPNGYSETGGASLIQSVGLSTGVNVYSFTYTNSCGAQVTQPFTITVGPTTDLIPNGTYVVTAVNSGLAIDDPDSTKTNGTDMQIYTVNDGANQQWTVNNVSTNVITLTNVASGQLLDVSGDSKAGEALVDQWPANGQTNQEWNVISVAGGAFELTSVNSGLALGVVGGGTTSETKIDQYTYGGNAWQQWKFTSF